MNIEVDKQLDDASLPSADDCRRWALAAISAAQQGEGDIAIQLVDSDSIRQLNRDFRHKDAATNVLSFPFEMPAGISGVAPILGDLMICAEVVAREAEEQQKPLDAHWAHMVVHGTLHLLGYDHIDDADAERMEALEIDILAQLGYANPYLTST